MLAPQIQRFTKRTRDATEHCNRTQARCRTSSSFVLKSLSKPYRDLKVQYSHDGSSSEIFAVTKRMLKVDRQYKALSLAEQEAVFIFMNPTSGYVTRQLVMQFASADARSMAEANKSYLDSIIAFEADLKSRRVAPREP